MDQHNTAFTVSNDAFAHAVSWVARNLPTKPTQPVLRGLIVDATDEGLVLSGYDYELSTVTRVAAEVRTVGKFAVNGKLLSDLVSTLPNEKAVDVTVNDVHAHFSCGFAKFDLPLIPLHDYPALPELPSRTGTVDSELFREAVSQVAIAAGRDDTLPVLTSINMKIDGNQVTLAATDRFRLAVRNFEWNPSVPETSASLLIPARTLLDNARSMCTGLKQDITILAGDGNNAGSDGLFGIEAGERQTTTRMIDADFPNYRPLLPKSHTSMAIVEIAPLLEAIKRVSIVAERNSQIRMTFSSEVVTLSAGGSDAGHAEEAIPCTFVSGNASNPSGDTEEEQTLTTAYNANYLKEGLNALGSNKVMFGFTLGSRPAVLVNGDENSPELSDSGEFTSPDANFTYLLMPVRLPG